MNSKIGRRIFLITLLTFTILVSLILVFQKSFFEKFYIKEKIAGLNTNLNTFRVDNSLKGSESILVYDSMYKFQEDNNTQLGIFYLDDSSGIFTPNTRNDVRNILRSLFTGFTADKSSLSTLISSGNVKTETYYSPDLDTNIIVSVCPMSIHYTNDSILLAVSTVHPIREASDVLSGFIPYFIIATLLVAVVYSIILSKFIASPLIRLNKIASKMSNMDFSERYSPVDNDEINNLGKTLNFLSSNLSEALKDLKNKNEMLQNEVKREREIEEMRKNFIANVSHELKTPIGIIEGYAEGLRDGVLKDSDSSYFNIIIDEAHKMNKLVMDMLELSKLQSGTIKPKFENFNIIRMINLSLRKYSGLIHEKNLTINFNVPFEYMYVIGDTFQIEQVLSNFITNAIKYTPVNNQIIITMEKLNKKVLVSIENLGTAISPEELDIIWNKFYKIDKSGKRDGNSSGLGLSIAREILELHKSSYGIKNTERGVLAYFTLESGPELNCDAEVIEKHL